MDTRGNHHGPYNQWDPPAPPPPPPPPDFPWGGGGFHHFNGPPEHFNGPAVEHFNGPPHLFRKRKLDRPPDLNPGFAKLYVDPVPRNVCQDEVFHLFEEFGHIIEVVLLTDKMTGLQQEFCFVKYASVEEAQRAITALHGQFVFPGAMAPLKVKFADREKKRLGWDYIGQHDSSFSRSGGVQHDSNLSGPVSDDTVHKVYVNGLNRDASKEEIAEIFSPFGIVTDIYIMRDEMKRSRGCGFVGFAQRCMAMAAINGLNGTYMMRGGDMPLAVRFADPKKPKNVDFRPTTHSADVQRNNVSSALHLGNAPAWTKLSSSGEQTGLNCIVPNQPRCPPREMQQMLTGKPFSPLRLSKMSLQVSQTSKSPKACKDVKVNSDRLSSEHGSCALSEIDYSEAFEDCDWSEHICPDGDKYYFNCVTSESSWEKPEDFALCEQRIQRLKSQDRFRIGSRASSTLNVAFNEVNRIKAAQYQKSHDYEKLKSPVSCAAEHGHKLAPDDPSSVGGPAFVQ